MADKPTMNQIDWASMAPLTSIIEPPVEKKKLGWFAKERIPYQWLNWILMSLDQWIKYCVSSIDNFDSRIVDLTDGLMAQLTAILDNYVLKSDVTLVARPNKILAVNSANKLAVDITGDATTLDGKHSGEFALANGNENNKFAVADAELDNQAVNLRKILDLLGKASLPIGTVITWTNWYMIPDGYYECDGGYLQQSEFPELYAKIGNTFGSAPTGQFKKPDFRGEFLRGWSHGRSGVDIGRGFATFQLDDIKAHYHSYIAGGSGVSDVNGATTDGNYAPQNTSSVGGSETRPRNIAIIYLIKAKNLIGGDPLVYHSDADTLDGLHSSAFSLANHFHSHVIPYSVNSGSPNFVAKIDNSNIKIVAGNGREIIKYTYPDYSQDTMENDVLVTVAGTNFSSGTYSSIVPIMADYTQDGFTVSSSSEQRDPTWGAFTDSDTNYWTGYTGVPPGHGDQGMPQWLKVQLPVSKTARRYTLNIQNGGNIYAWKFQGSNDNSNWTDLDTKTGQNLNNYTTYTYNFINSTAYLYYRLYVTGAQNTWVVIGHFNIYEYFGGNNAVSLVPVMTSNNQDGWTASGSYTTNRFPWKAFDDSVGVDGSGYGLGAGLATGWLKISKNSDTFDVKRIDISAYNSGGLTIANPKNFTIKDQNDAILLTVTNQINWLINETRTFELPSTVTVSVIKIDVSAGQGGQSEIFIGEVEIYDKTKYFDDGNYILVKEKGNADIIPVGGSNTVIESAQEPIGMDVEPIPIMTSNSQNGWTVEGSKGGSSAYLAFDQNAGTKWDAGNQLVYGNCAVEYMPVYMYVTAPRLVNMSKILINNSCSIGADGRQVYSASCTVYLSTDGGITYPKSYNLALARYAETFITFPSGSAVWNKLKIEFHSGNNAEVTYGTHRSGYTETWVKGMAVADIRIFEPLTAADGNYWLDKSVIPNRPYKRVNGQWQDCQFLTIGEFQLLSGVIGNLITYAFNRRATIKLANCAANKTYVINHNIGTKIKPPTGTFENVAATNGTLLKGTGGYVIGQGSERYSGLHYDSRLIITDKNNCTLQTGTNGLYMDAIGNIISGADAEITLEGA